MSARSHLLSRIGVSLLVASLAVLVWSASASGHAAFLDSRPGPGVRVKSSPSEIALDFTEPLNRQLSRARVVEVSTGKRAQARVEASARRLVLRPAMPLGRAAYRLRSPDRFAYRTNGQAQTVVVGKDQWFRTPASPWMRTEYGGGLPFRTRSWFRWTPYARAVRLLGVRRVGGRRLVELALMDPGTPVWQRLLVDSRSMRIPRERMITKGHYMTRIYSGFNEPLDIEPPARSGRVG